MAPVPLKWVERVILRHMEADLKIYCKFSKKQYGFWRGCSTVAAMQKLVMRLETAILNNGIAISFPLMLLNVPYPVTTSQPMGHVNDP